MPSTPISIAVWLGDESVAPAPLLTMPPPKLVVLLMLMTSSLPAMVPVLVMPPARVPVLVTRIPGWKPWVSVPALVMPPVNVLTPETLTPAWVSAPPGVTVPLPLLTTLPLNVAPEIRMPVLAEVIVPELLILPPKLVPVSEMALSWAATVPELVMPPWTTPLMPTPTEMAPVVLPVIVPELVMPPESVPALVTATAPVLGAVALGPIWSGLLLVTLTALPVTVTQGTEPLLL